jgi:uncharacterized protein (TIGR02611 family)
MPGNCASDTTTDKFSEEWQKPNSSRAARVVANLRRTRTGRLALRIGIGAAGALIIAVGIILLPLPGPGWVIIFAGLALWSVEFEWARRLRRFTLRKFMEWTRWYTARGWLVRIVVGIATAVIVAAIVVLSLFVSLGSDRASDILPGV